MGHRTSALAAAFVLTSVGLVSTGVLPVAAAAPPGVSATSGAPGTKVSVTIPGCVSDDVAGLDRYTRALLISGTAPDEVLAGAGSSGYLEEDDGTAVIVVPDWVDADAPAVIEAACFETDYTVESVEDLDDPFPTTVTAADPVAFDILPGAVPPTQTRSYSRTSLLSSQGFEVAGTGCDLPGATYATVDVFAGNDPTGRSFVESVNFGGGEVDGTDYLASTILGEDGGVGFGYSSNGPSDPHPMLDAQEFPSTLAPGTYTSVSSCADDDGTSLLFEPQRIEVTGAAPADQIDLVVAADQGSVTLAGSGCTAGSVEADIMAEDLVDLLADDDVDGPYLDVDVDGPDDPDVRVVDGARLASSSAAEGRHGPFARPGDRTPPRSGLSRPGRHQVPSSKVLDGTTDVSMSIDPDGAGTWSYGDRVGFRQGFVLAFATCGDPFADGFVYDSQVTVIDRGPGQATTTATANANATTTTTVAPAPTPAPTTSPAPAAHPANAVNGRPNYAG